MSAQAMRCVFVRSTTKYFSKQTKHVTTT